MYLTLLRLFFPLIQQLAHNLTVNLRAIGINFQLLLLHERHNGSDFVERILTSFYLSGEDGVGGIREVLEVNAVEAAQLVGNLPRDLAGEEELVVQEVL